MKIGVDNLQTDLPVKEILKSIDLEKLNIDIITNQIKAQNQYTKGISYETIQLAKLK